MKLVIRLLQQHSAAVAIILAAIILAWVFRYSAVKMSDTGIFIDHWTGQFYGCNDSGKCDWVAIP